MLSSVVRDGGGKVDNDLIVEFKQFDPETGQEIAPRIDQFTKGNLEARKQELESELADVNAMLDEFANL